MFRKKAEMEDDFDTLVGEMYKAGIYFREALAEFQKLLIATALRENKGSVSKTAPKLGLHRNTLTRIMTQLGLDASAFRPAPRLPPRSVRSACTEKKISR